MIAFAYYLLKVIVCSGLLFSYYHIALRNRLFHQWNRFYLLASVVSSLIVPCLQFNIRSAENEKQSASIQLLNVVYAADEYVAEINTKQTNISNEQWSTLSYSTVSIALLVLFILALLRIRSIVRSHSVMLIDDIKFVNTEEKNAPFSFLNYVFWNRQIELNSPSGEHIFKHELVHVRERHSLDKLFLQLVLAVYWCNPFFWLIRKELKMIHEFIADQRSVGQSDARAFATMILQATYPSHFSHLTNQFFQSSIKRRLSMLTKQYNPRISYISRLLVLPLIAFIVLAFTIKSRETTAVLPLEKEITVVIDAGHGGGDGAISEGYTEDELVLQLSKTVKANNTTGKISTKHSVKQSVTKDTSVLPEIVVVDLMSTRNDLEKNSPDAASPKSIFFDSKKKIAIEFDEITHSTTPEKSTVNIATAMLIVNGEKVPNDIFKRKTIITNKLKFIEGKDAVKVYGQAASPGAVVFEGARYIDVPVAKYYKDVFYPKEVVKSNPDNMVFERVEVEAQFPGGVNAWNRYLGENLNSSVPKINKAPRGSYTVVAKFLVNTDGTISDVKALTSHGYGMEEEVIRVIKQGPKWTPPIQNGRNVNAYQKQPITFSVSAR